MVWGGWKRTYVVPERHDQNHVALESLGHLGEATLLGEVVCVTEGGLLGLAEILGDLIAGHAVNGALRVGDDLAILHVVALDGLEAAALTLDELGHDGELLGGVNRHAGAVEVLDTHAVRVEVASVGVAGAGVAGIGVRATTVVAGARLLTNVSAGVGSEGGGDAVGLYRFFSVSLQFKSSYIFCHSPQISISEQQEPITPTPAFSSLEEGSHWSEFALPSMNFRSRGH
jgi:hypothetical protein